MENVKNVSPFAGGQFNTLAQSGTAPITKLKDKPPITVKGSGTELSNSRAMRNRSKKKTITQKLILCLIDVAIKKGEQERIQAYWNTWHCQNRIYSSGGRVYGKYCKNRFCPVCCGIRKAEIINNYLPAIQKWKAPHFVTLTLKAVPANQLKKRIIDMFIAFRKIIDKFRKWHTKGKSIKLAGVKSLECNFNPVKKTYNPHFHIITPDKATANLLMQEWCKYWGYGITNKSGQDIREVNDPEKCLIEIIKYFSKIFTAPDMIKKPEKKVAPVIYVSAIDNIIWAMKGRRIFDRFGFDLPAKPKIKGGKALITTQYDEWIHSPKQTDWINAEDSDQLLTGYVLTSELMAILDNNINTDLE